MKHAKEKMASAYIRTANNGISKYVKMVVTRIKRIGNSINVLWQAACMLVSQIRVDNIWAADF